MDMTSLLKATLTAADAARRQRDTYTVYSVGAVDFGAKDKTCEMASQVGGLLRGRGAGVCTTS
jgi:hypothetical protein